MYPSPQKLLLKRLFVIVFCLSGASTAAYFLYLDMYAGGAGKGVAVAEVTRKVSKVRRKSKASFLWMNVQDGSSLFKRDSLHVGGGSAATVRLKDNSLLEIGEHSLVIIDDVPPLEMKFVKGNFTIRGKDKDYRIEAKENKEPLIRAIPVRLLSPEPFQTFYLEKNAASPILFEWLALGNNKEAADIQQIVQVSRSAKFLKKLTTQHPTNKVGQSMVRVPLKPGKYFWRLMASSTAKPETRKFEVKVAKTPKPVWPTKEANIRRWDDVGDVELRWVSPTGSYPNAPQLLLSKSPKFEKDQLVVNRKIVPLNGRLLLHNIPSGEYYWRIVTRYPRFNLASKVEKFTLETKRNIPIKLASPNDNAKVDIKKGIKFSWDFQAEGALFQIQVEKFTNATETTLKEDPRLTSPIFQWKSNEPGKYRWRVLALWNEKIVSTSPWRQFQLEDKSPIALTSPADKEELRYWKDPPVFSFRWSDEPLSHRKEYSYQLLLAEDSELKSNRKVLNPPENSFGSQSLNLPDGKFFWQVRLVDKMGTIVKSSPVRSFRYGLFDKLTAPKGIFPSNKAVINIVQLRRDPVATWTAVPNAKAYEIKINNAEGRTIASETTEETKYPLKDMKQGRYHWTVRAIDPLERKGTPSRASYFSIDYGDVLEAPEILGSQVE